MMAARAPAPQHNSSCGSACHRSKEQRGAAGGRAAARVPAVVHDVLASGGHRLDAGVRATMESRFGHDFADVRIHSDHRAGVSARAIDADAYAFGHRIVFQPHLYRPDTGAGRRLIAHELAHVVQQRGAAPASPLTIGDPGAQAEADADRAASAVMRGATAALPAAAPAAPAALRRQPSSDGYGRKAALHPDLELKLDPQLTAMFLASCRMGKGDPKLCAEVRARAMGEPLPPSPQPALDLSPGSPAMKAILAGIHKPPIFLPARAPGQQPLPAVPGAAPDPGFDTSAFDEIGKTIEKVTKFEFHFKHGVVKVTLPSSVVAEVRPLANARNVVFSAKAESSGAFTAAMTIDRSMPIALSAKVDAADKTFNVSLTLDSGRGDCQVKVAADAISKVQDAADKLAALFTKADPNAAALPAPLRPVVPPPAPEAPKTGIEKAVGDAVDSVEAVAAKLKGEIEIGKAVAAFVDAMGAIKDRQKDQCTKPRFQAGAFYQQPIGDPDDPNVPKGATTLGLGLKILF